MRRSNYADANLISVQFVTIVERAFLSIATLMRKSSVAVNDAYGHDATTSATSSYQEPIK